LPDAENKSIHQNISTIISAFYSKDVIKSISKYNYFIFTWIISRSPYQTLHRMNPLAKTINWPTNRAALTGSAALTRDQG